MGTILQDKDDPFLGLRTNLSYPSDQAGGSPFEIFLMGFGMTVNEIRAPDGFMEECGDIHRTGESGQIAQHTGSNEFLPALAENLY